MAKDTSDHRKKALLGASIVAVTFGIGYVLLAVFSVGLAIVGLFPVVLLAGLWTLANVSMYVSQSSASDDATTVGATGTPGSGVNTAAGSGDRAQPADDDPDSEAVDGQLETILEISRELASDADEGGNGGDESDRDRAVGDEW